MDEEVAYTITKTLLESKEELVRGHNFFRDLAPENIVGSLVTPLHPGAERYYREIGIVD
jgi:TRAP-type uncharacterized transport system substrate-binding protein